MWLIFRKHDAGTRCQLFGLLLVTALLMQTSALNNDTQATTTRLQKRSPSQSSIQSERPAIAACRRFYENATEEFIKPNIGSKPVQLGQYPHVAAIGYKTIGNDDGSYEFLCGGTLIEDRFVLTAAHCVSEPSIQPVIVRLGVVDLDNAEQTKNGVEIPIKKIHIHPSYSNRLKIHDIAVLELEYPSDFSKNIRPTCLYTDILDPSKDSEIIFTGWGSYDIKTKKSSNILTESKLEIVDEKTCREAFSSIELNSGHLCAIDENNTSDACQADSGSPLNLIVGDKIKRNSVVGVVSTGIGCGAPTYGLYARVANYLDFIEGIVWAK